ncbi:MAG TPA: arginase family protein [Thermoleophilia bacterium]|nr:arginase family protein [Thermoleophilia bacterium]
MDVGEVKAIWERAALRAQQERARPERSMAPILRGDVPTFAEAPAAIGPTDLARADVVVLGIPYEGVKLLDPLTYVPPLAAPAPEGSVYYRSGADEGPEAIRRYSVLASLRHGRGLVPETDRDLVILDRLRVVDYGDVDVVPGDVEATFLRAHEKLADIVAAGAVPIVLGGDHSIPIPVLQVLAGKLRGRLGVVVLDSHFDMSYEPRYWAGSQWARVFELGMVEPENFVQIGIRGVRESLADRAVADELGYRYYTMSDVDELGVAAVAQEALEAATRGTEALYISLDIDVVDTAHGGQKYPEPGGLSARELLRALRVLSRAHVAGFDLCCLAPRYDLQGHLSQLAARAALEVIAGVALQRPADAAQR